MLRQVLNMFTIDMAFLGTPNRRPWNRPPDLRSLEGDPETICSTGYRWTICIGVNIPIKILSPEGRGQGTTWTARFFVSPTVHCKARSLRLQSPIVAMAMALETLVTVLSMRVLLRHNQDG